MAETTAIGLVHNLDTDPNCLKQRKLMALQRHQNRRSLPSRVP